jgi:hypothetical protein
MKSMTPIMALSRTLVMMRENSHSSTESIADVSDVLRRHVERRLRTAGRPMTLDELLGADADERDAG